MDYRRSGSSGLKVSEICVGTMTFGHGTDAAEADRLVGAALDAGVNFFDTADGYGNGASETMLGAALGNRRRDVVVATKVFNAMGPGPNDSGMSRAHILTAVEDSLRRLGTDYIDVYFIHHVDIQMPLEEMAAGGWRLPEDMRAAGQNLGPKAPLSPRDGGNDGGTKERRRENANGRPPMIDPAKDRVLITGAAGAIGTAVRNGLRAEWRHLRLIDIKPVANLTNNEEGIVADVADRAAMEAATRDVAAVVHLAGMIGDFNLESLFRVNARGLFDVFESARLGGVKRIVFASSNHAFGCYPITEPVSPALPPRPDSLYGVFKVLGETILQNYYDRHAVRSVSLRIGTYRIEPIDQRSLATWLSPGDVARLVEASLRHPDPGCLIVNGYSNNTRLKTHDTNWDFLGYHPRDNAEDFREALRAKGVDVDSPDREEWEWPEHGGSHARAPEKPAR